MLGNKKRRDIEWEGFVTPRGGMGGGGVGGEAKTTFLDFRRGNESEIYTHSVVYMRPLQY